MDSIFNGGCCGGGSISGVTVANVIINNNSYQGSQWSNVSNLGTNGDVYLLSNVAIGSNNTTLAKLYVNGNLNVSGTITGQPLTGLVTSNARIWSNLNSLQSNINTVQSNLDTSNSQIYSNLNALQSNINTVQSNLATANGLVYSNLNSLQSNINTVQSNLATANGLVYSNLNSLQSNINTVQSNLATANGLVYSNISNIYDSLGTSSQWSNSGQDVYVISNVAIGSSNTTTGNKLYVNGNILANSFTGNILGNSNVFGNMWISNTLYVGNNFVGDLYLTGNIYVSGNLYGEPITGLVTSNGLIYSNISNIYDNLTSYSNEFSILTNSDVTLGNLTYITYINGSDILFNGVSVNTIESLIASLQTSNGFVWSNLNTLQSNINTVQSNLSSMQSNVTSLQISNGLVWSNMNALQSNINTVQSNLTSMQSNVTSLQTSNGLVWSNLNSLQSNVSSLQTSNGLVWSNLNSLQSNINTVQSNLDTSNSQIYSNLNALQSNINTVQSNLDTSNSQIYSNLNALQSNINTVQSNLSSMQSNVTSLQTSNGLVWSNLNSLQSNLSSMQSNVTSLQTSNGLVWSNLNSLQSNINTVQSNLSSMQSNVTSLQTSNGLVYSNISNIYSSLGGISSWVTSGSDIYFLNNVAIGTTSTTTGDKLNVSGNVAATYFKGDGSLLTLPTVSTTTLGLAKVDGITVTASSGGVISAAGSVGGGGQTLYMSNVVTGSAPYDYGIISRTANTSIPSNTVTYTFSNDNNPHLLATFLTTNGTITSNVIPSGIWDFNFYVSASGTSPQLDIYANVFYVYSSTKTIIASGSVNFTQASYTTTTLVNHSVYVPTTVFTDYTTTVIGVDVYVLAPAGNPNGKTVTLYTNDSTLSHVHTMLPTSIGFVTESSANSFAFYSAPNTISGTSNVLLNGTGINVVGNVTASYFSGEFVGPGITGINSNITSLQTSNGLVYSNLNALQSNINTVQSNLTTENSLIYSNINTVQSNLSTSNTLIYSNLNTLQSNINTVQSNLTTENSLIYSNINTVQSNLSTSNTLIYSNLNTLQSNINTVQSNLTTENSLIYSNINTLQSNINTVQSNLSLADSNITTLKNEVLLGGALSDETTTLTISNYTSIRAPFAFVINTPRIPLFWLNVLPTVTSNTVFDILKNGVSIYTTKPQIGSGTTSNVSANSVPGVLIGNTNSVAIYDLLTIDVDTVGSGTPSGAKFVIYCS